jgi:hypothetical protein
MNVSFKFNENDVDDVGNKFSAVYVRLENGKESKFIAVDEYPRMHGLVNGVEIWDADFKQVKKWQLPIEFMQPYAAFCEEKMLLWPPTFPGFLQTEKPIEIPYSMMNEWHTVSLKDIN